MSFRRLALFASRRNLLCLHQKPIPRFARDDKLRDFFSILLEAKGTGPHLLPGRYKTSGTNPRDSRERVTAKEE